MKVKARHSSLHTSQSTPSASNCFAASSASCTDLEWAAKVIWPPAKQKQSKIKFSAGYGYTLAIFSAKSMKYAKICHVTFDKSNGN